MAIDPTWLKTNVYNIIMDGVSSPMENIMELAAELTGLTPPGGGGGNIPPPTSNQPEYATSTEINSKNSSPPTSWPKVGGVMASWANRSKANDYQYPHIFYWDGAVPGSKPSVDRVNPNLLADIERAAVIANAKPVLTTAITGHSRSGRHNPSGQAVDIAMFSGKGYGSKAAAKTNGIYDEIKRFESAMVSLGYIYNNEAAYKKGLLSFGFKDHDNHVHVSNVIRSS
jgi:hypothetical protein